MKDAAWQKIETAPKDGTDILAWDGQEYHIIAFVSGQWCSNGEMGLDREPTHWKPLHPPKDPA